MVERDEPWPPGTPCWTDLMSTDIDAARAFYGALFGWDLALGPPETGGYTMAEVRGRAVAGLGSVPPGTSMPTVWTTYLATTDADATAAAIAVAGGTVFQAPFDVMTFGRMGIAADPTGAMFGFWQAGEHWGAALANEVDSMVWNECLSRDWRAAEAFYAQVFGFTYTEMDGAGIEYASIEVDGNTAGGIGAMPSGAPEAAPSGWIVYFRVVDTDAAAAQAVESGGSVLRAPSDSPFGRTALLADPQGGTFTVISYPDDRA